MVFHLAFCALPTSLGPSTEMAYLDDLHGRNTHKLRSCDPAWPWRRSVLYRLSKKQGPTSTWCWFCFCLALKTKMKRFVQNTCLEHFDKTPTTNETVGPRSAQNKRIIETSRRLRKASPHRPTARGSNRRKQNETQTVKQNKTLRTGMQKSKTGNKITCVCVWVTFSFRGLFKTHAGKEPKTTPTTKRKHKHGSKNN